MRDRADLNKDKPVIPAAALAGYTGRRLPLPRSLGGRAAVGGLSGGPWARSPKHRSLPFLFAGSGEKTLKRSGQSLRPLCL